MDLSLLLAFSTALFSYSSHNFAVFAGVLGGGGRGSLKGESALASGEGWCGANVMVEVDDVILKCMEGSYRHEQ